MSNLNRHPKVGVGLMMIRNGKILLGKRKNGYGLLTYGWVGGHLEFGETLEECVRREALEETGLSISSLKLLSVSDIVDQGTHYVDIEFLTENFIGEPKLLEPDNTESWDWYELDDLPFPLFRPVELAIESYKSGIIYDLPTGKNNKTILP